MAAEAAEQAAKDRRRSIWAVVALILILMWGIGGCLPSIDEMRARDDSGRIQRWVDAGTGPFCDR